MKSLSATPRTLHGFDVFSSRISPWAEQAEEHVRAWVRSTGLIRSDAAGRRFDETAAGCLTARVYADATTAENLCTAADWIGWLFLFDDQVDEGLVGRTPHALHTLLRRVRTVLEDDGPPTGPEQPPLVTALADIWQRIRAAPMPSSWRSRFVLHVNEYFDACVREAQNRELRRLPNTQEFPQLRRDAGAIWPSLDLLEFVTWAALPNPIPEDPLFQQLATAAADVVCWTDDVFTAPKERARGDFHNLVILLEALPDYPGAQASTHVENLIALRIRDFLAREHYLPRLCDALNLEDNARHAVERYSMGLRDWMRGHLEWGRETARYHTVEHTPDNVLPSYLDDLWR